MPLPRVSILKYYAGPAFRPNPRPHSRLGFHPDPYAFITTMGLTLRVRDFTNSQSGAISATIPRPIPNSYWATPLVLACEFPWTPAAPCKLDALLRRGSTLHARERVLLYGCYIQRKGELIIHLLTYIVLTLQFMPRTLLIPVAVVSRVFVRASPVCA
ncbi:hypothetical protein BDZ89DRAFT_488360 [Hymenopellis radicata]|nr:hypothetical protein BDZ89DRAFT_488360 [Hymenopellis radicata]